MPARGKEVQRLCRGSTQVDVTRLCVLRGQVMAPGAAQQPDAAVVCEGIM